MLRKAEIAKHLSASSLYEEKSMRLFPLNCCVIIYHSLNRNW